MEIALVINHRLIKNPSYGLMHIGTHSSITVSLKNCYFNCVGRLNSYKLLHAVCFLIVLNVLLLTNYEKLEKFLNFFNFKISNKNFNYAHTEKTCVKILYPLLISHGRIKVMPWMMTKLNNSFIFHPLTEKAR